MQGGGGYTSAPCSAATNSVYFTNQALYSPYASSVIAHLYTPSTFAQGSSVSHVDEIVDFSSHIAVFNELMQPVSNVGIQLAPKNTVASVLSKIGWTINSTVSTSDQIYIKNHYAISPASYACAGTPLQIINPGFTNHYCIDGTPSIAYWDTQWKLMLFAEDGNTYTVATGSGVNWDLSITTSDLSGHNWIRDLNGNVTGVITAVCHDYSTSIGVGVMCAPQRISFAVNNSSDFWCLCDKETVSFFSPGATSYKVSKRTQFFTGTWSTWSSPVTIASGNSSYTFTGLDEYNNYQFQVQAVNAQGTVTSNILTRYRCKNWINLAPNPTVQSSAGNFTIDINSPSAGTNGVDYADQVCNVDAGIQNIGLGMDNIVYNVSEGPIDPCGPKPHFWIKNVLLTDVRYPANPTYNFNYNGTGSSVQVSTANIPLGLYAVTITSEDGQVASSTIEIN